ncbi:DUF1330 domain-containing protein [Paenibacillus rhizophilus]|uniref:DUF1330 domain-containing protein n=1 Tax=Paenibacillus rhizophilus TaxID=1850366 RepID=A0A3N9P1G4_9BACL|nr:DUF1330 domain-containing protein [Paenibacillus rhizophilus]RQW09685.1 DUF1330 domain-containing protein [Paenibacillus rhizophilus]
MTAYVIVDIEVENEEVFKEYAAKADAILKEVPGFRNLTIDVQPKVLEGNWKPSTVVVHEFPDYEAAQKFYYSEAYAPLIQLRQSATKASVILVNGRE